jgi:hypothetical protein
MLEDEMSEAMTQALEALEEWEKPMSKGSLEAHRILRTAIEQAEKQEPYGYVSIGNSPVFRKEKPEIGRWKTVYTTPPAAPVPWSQALESVWAEDDTTPPAQPAPEQEPMPDDLIASYEKGFKDGAAQRQPLTDEQIELGRRVLSCFDLNLFMAGARFAEAAHGIKEKNT